MWCNTSRSWWGHGTAPYPATHFFHRPLSRIDALQLGPQVLQLRGGFWFYCSLWEKFKCFEGRGWNTSAPLLTNHRNISILRRWKGVGLFSNPKFPLGLLAVNADFATGGGICWFWKGQTHLQIKSCWLDITAITFTAMTDKRNCDQRTVKTK